MNRIRVYTRSLGCPKNLVDTENILAGLGPGWSPAASPAEAEVVLINTCAFIRPAVEESLEAIFALAGELHGLNPRPFVVVTGCLVSRYGVGLGREIPEADLYVPVKKQKDLPARILARLGLPGRQTTGWQRPAPRGSYAYLKISEGCSNRCSFCTIPSIRGRLRSRPVPELTAEASWLVDHGAKEIILVSQDSTAYGRDLGWSRGLAGLAGELCGISGLERLRIMYMYPSGLDRKLLAALAGLGRPFVPYFDVPVQHAHRDILMRMGRPFQQDPLQIIDNIRSFFPDAAIRTTLIAGYPGEKEEHFRAVLDFVHKARVQHLGVFPYYPEEGTRASGFSGQVPGSLKEKRRRLIMQEQRKISRAYLQRFVGQSMEVLVDEPHAEWPGLFTGRAWFQAPDADGITYISGPEAEPGRLIRAEITNSFDFDLEALA